MSVRLDSILPLGWLDLFSNHPLIGIGLDPATTTKAKSNPSGLAVVQRVNLVNYARLALRYKTSDPDVTLGLLRAILTGLRGRGLSVRKVVILATNERFFAVAVRKALAPLALVELLIESENTVHGGEQMKFKAYLGNLYVNAIEDGYLALPPERWVRDDARQVVRDRGTFDAEVAEDGGHADVFAGVTAALHAVNSRGGPAGAAGAPVGTFGVRRQVDPSRKLVNPNAGRGGRLPARLT